MDAAILRTLAKIKKGGEELYAGQSVIQSELELARQAAEARGLKSKVKAAEEQVSSIDLRIVFDPGVEMVTEADVPALPSEGSAQEKSARGRPPGLRRRTGGAALDLRSRDEEGEG